MVLVARVVGDRAGMVGTRIGLVYLLAMLVQNLLIQMTCAVAVSIGLVVLSVS